MKTLILAKSFPAFRNCPKTCHCQWVGGGTVRHQRRLCGKVVLLSVLTFSPSRLTCMVIKCEHLLRYKSVSVWYNKNDQPVRKSLQIIWQYLQTETEHWIFTFKMMGGTTCHSSTETSLKRQKTKHRPLSETTHRRHNILRYIDDTKLIMKM